MEDSIDRKPQGHVPRQSSTSTSGNQRLDRYVESVQKLERASNGGKSASGPKSGND